MFLWYSFTSHFNAFCRIQQILSHLFQVFFAICVVRFEHILFASFRSNFTLFRGSFLTYLKFPQIKEAGLNFLGEPILQNDCIIWSSLLYFNFKFWGPRLFLIHKISMHSAWLRSTFLRLFKFLQINKWGPN